MTTDTWNGNGNWATDLGDWSLGAAPGATTDVNIQTGTVTLNTTATVGSILINENGVQTFYIGGAGNLTAAAMSSGGNFRLATNNGDGGNTVNITGSFGNGSSAILGNPFLSANTTMTVGSYTVDPAYGVLSLFGNQTLGTTKQMTFKVNSAAPSTLTGQMLVHGDADVIFASGGITTIASNAELQLDGQQSRISIGAGTTNSALSNLSANLGTFDVEGDWSTGPGGSAVNITGALMNSGNFDLDTYNNDGASQIKINGALTNFNAVQVGNSYLSADSTLTVGSLVNFGTINLFGNQTLGTTEQATLNVLGAAPSTLTGKIYIHGDSLVEFASGGITSIAAGAELQLDGQQSRFSIGAGTTNSALSGLASNYGTFDEEGDWSTGPGGSVVSTSAAFTNYATFQLDVYNNDGASTFTDSGVFTNNGSVQVGNDYSSANITMTVAGLANNNYFYVDSQRVTGSGQPLSLVKVLSAAPSIANGFFRVAGNSVINFASGAVQSIAYGATLEVDGAASYSVGAGGVNSALKTLSSNSGTLDLRGDNGFGSGVSLTTTTGLINTGSVYVDSLSNGDSGSTYIIGGALNNSSVFYIGNQYASAATTVKAASLSNSGRLEVVGSNSDATSPLTTLAITGAVNSNITSYTLIAGHALLSIGSGPGYTSIANGGWLEIDGAQANVKLGAGGAVNSGVAGLTQNAGTFVLRGDQSFAQGAATVNLTGSYNNIGTTDIDELYNGDGGSTLNIGGTLTNSGVFNVGNQYEAGSTTVTAALLRNSNQLRVVGSNGNATSPVTTLAIAGAAVPTVTSYTQIAGHATLSFGSGSGYTAIASGGQLEIDGALANVKLGAGGAQNSGVANLTLNQGLFVLRGDTGFAQGAATVTTATRLTNQGTLDIDSLYNGDGGSTFNVGGVLNNTGTVNIGNLYLPGATTVSVTNFVNSGTLTLLGNANVGGAMSTFNIGSPAAGTLTGSWRVGGSAKLDFASGTGFAAIGAAGYLELDGQSANVAVGAGAQNSGLANLASNAGKFVLRGNSNQGAGGVTVATSGKFANTGTTLVDALYNGDGGSTFNINGTLINQGTMYIGNLYLDANTLVTATALANTGSLTLLGNTNTTGPSATLNITGASPGIVTNFIRVGGDATLSFGTGNGLTSIASGGTLEIDGSEASVVVGAGAQNSGLAKLGVNNGTLTLRGDSNQGGGGVSITTTSGYTNSGTTIVDALYNGDGGSVVKFGGALTNQGTFNLGNYYTAAVSSVSATALSNFYGQINIAGSTNLSTMSITGAANNYAGVFVGTGGVLAVGGAYTQFGGATTINGTLSATSYTQNGGSTLVNGNLDAATINVHNSRFEFGSALTSTTGETAIDTSNGGSYYFDAGVSSAQTVNFQDGTGAIFLKSPGAFNATIAGFQVGDQIDLLNQAATSLSFSGGALDVFNGATQVATLHMTGSYTTSEFNLVSDNNGGTRIFI